MTNNSNDADIPLLTDIVTDIPNPTPSGLVMTEQAQKELADTLCAQLSSQSPNLIATAVQEHLPQLIGQRLESATTTALGNVLPEVTATVTKELTSQLMSELSLRLSQNLEAEVKSAVADQIAKHQS